MTSSLDVRHLARELMDDPCLDPAVHRRALRGLKRINFISRTVGDVWCQLQRCLRDRGLARARVLDLATGGGDLAIGLGRCAQRAAFPLEIVATDISPLALDVTARRAHTLGVQIHPRLLDALMDDWPDDIDVVVSSLFLHHLTDDDAIAVLGRAKNCARHALIISDLRRTRAGLVLAQAGVRLLSRSYVVHADGPQSVRAAFTVDEMRSVAERAGLQDVEITPVWPQRQRFVWMHH